MEVFRRGEVDVVSMNFKLGLETVKAVKEIERRAEVFRRFLPEIATLSRMAESLSVTVGFGGLMKYEYPRLMFELSGSGLDIDSFGDCVSEWAAKTGFSVGGWWSLVGDDGRRVFHSTCFKNTVFVKGCICIEVRGGAK